MGNVCSERRQYKVIIASVYPKDESDDKPNQDAIRKLTMYCLNNSDLLPTIGNRIEKLIRNDLLRKKYSKVLVGCRALESIIVTCHDDLSYFIINIESIVHLLIEHSDVRLKIQATEILNKALEHVSASQFRRIDAFVKRLIEMSTTTTTTTTTTTNSNNNQQKQQKLQQQQLKVKIASMRTLSKMTSSLDASVLFERHHEILPPVLSNLKDAITSASTTPTTNNNNNTTNTTNTTNTNSGSGSGVVAVPQSLLDSINRDDYHENGLSMELKKKNRSINDVDLLITNEHYIQCSIDCLSSIARTANLSNARNLMKPIIDYLDRDQNWQLEGYAQCIMRTLVSNGWSADGYYLVNFLIQHVDSITDNQPQVQVQSQQNDIVSTNNHQNNNNLNNDSNNNNNNNNNNKNVKQIFMIMNYIIQIQSKKGAVGPTALTTVTLLIRLLMKLSSQQQQQQQSSSSSPSSEQLQYISETIETIAKRGQFTSQNINIMSAILSNIKSCRTDREITVLLHVVLRVAAHASSTVSQGKFYPESLLKTIVDELMNIHNNNLQQAQQQQQQQSSSAVAVNAFNRGLLLELIQALIQNAALSNHKASSSITDQQVSTLVDGEQYINVSQSTIVTTTTTTNVVQTASSSTTTTAAATTAVVDLSEDAQQTTTTVNAAVISLNTPPDVQSTLAILSKKQRDDIHSVLFRILLSISSLSTETGVLIQVLKTLNCMLKQYRNKDLEGSIPLIFRVQELLHAQIVSSSNSMANSSSNASLDTVHTPTTTSPTTDLTAVVDGASSISNNQSANKTDAQPATTSITTTLSNEEWKKIVAVHSVIALFLMSLARLYSNKDVEKYVVSVIEQRIEQGQIHPNILTQIDDILAQMNTYNYRHSLLAQGLDNLLTMVLSFEGNKNNASIVLFNSQTIIDILCKVEAIKQSYDNARERLGTVFAATHSDARLGGSTVSTKLSHSRNQSSKEEDLDAHWDMIDDERDSVRHTYSVADLNEPNTDTELLVLDEQSNEASMLAINFIELGGNSMAKAQESQKAVHDLLNSLRSPKTNLQLSSNQMDEEDNDSTDTDEYNGPSETDRMDTSINSATVDIFHNHSKPLKAGRNGVTDAVPQFYLFDSPEFLTPAN